MAARELGQQLLGHPRADGGVQLGAVGEVPVDHGLAGPCLGGDLLHADAGAVPADRGQGRLDELFATGAPVFVPSRVAAIACLRHISQGAILFQVRTGRRLVLRRRSHRLGFHVTHGTAYSEYRPVHPTSEVFSGYDS